MPGKPLTLEVKGEKHQRTAGLVWVPGDAMGAFCTLREDGRGAWTGWALGKFHCRFGRLGALGSQFKVPAQPRSKVSLSLCPSMAVNWSDFGFSIPVIPTVPRFHLILSLGFSPENTRFPGQES